MASGQDAKQSILNKTGQKSTHHVAFGSTPGENKPKPAAPAKPTPAAAAANVTAPPPAAGFQIKDEVELLRSGFKNTHGDQVKSQGQTTGGGGGGGGAQSGGGTDRGATEIELK